MATLQRNLKLRPDWTTDKIKNKYRLTAIVCTIGSKTKEVDVLVKLLDTGMDVLRLNFSHGTHEVYSK
jgi:pyruvate kinase